MQVQLGDSGTSPGEGVSAAYHLAHCEKLLNVTARAKAGLGDVPKHVCGALFPEPSGVEESQTSSLRHSAPGDMLESLMGRRVIASASSSDMRLRYVGDMLFWRRRSLLFGSAPAALTPAELEERKSRNVRAPPPLHPVSKCNLSVA